jgi:hypothetical protein
VTHAAGVGDSTRSGGTSASRRSSRCRGGPGPEQRGARRLRGGAWHRRSSTRGTCPGLGSIAVGTRSSSPPSRASAGRQCSSPRPSELAQPATAWSTRLHRSRRSCSLCLMGARPVRQDERSVMVPVGRSQRQKAGEPEDACARVRDAYSVPRRSSSSSVVRRPSARCWPRTSAIRSRLASPMRRLPVSGWSGSPTDVDGVAVESRPSAGQARSSTGPSGRGDPQPVPAGACFPALDPRGVDRLLNNQRLGSRAVKPQLAPVEHELPPYKGG